MANAENKVVVAKKHSPELVISATRWTEQGSEWIVVQKKG
jgi:hypothetical protein